MASSAHCERLGRADGAPGLQPLRRTRRRLGRRRNELDGEATAGGACRYPSESSDPLSAASATTRRLYGGGTGSAGGAGEVPERSVWLCRPPRKAAANT